MPKRNVYELKAWTKVRKHVLTRDRYQCQVCGKVGNIAHHIIPLDYKNSWKDNIALNPDNLITLCQDCHNLVHNGSSEIGSEYYFDDHGQIIHKSDLNNKLLTKLIDKANK